MSMPIVAHQRGPSILGTIHKLLLLNCSSHSSIPSEAIWMKPIVLEDISKTLSDQIGARLRNHRGKLQL